MVVRKSPSLAAMTRRDMLQDYETLLRLLPLPLNPNARRCAHFMTNRYCGYYDRCTFNHPIDMQLQYMKDRRHPDGQLAAGLWKKLQLHAFYSCNEQDPPCMEFFDHGKCRCNSSVKPLFHPIDLQLVPTF